LIIERKEGNIKPASDAPTKIVKKEKKLVKKHSSEIHLSHKPRSLCAKIQVEKGQALEQKKNLCRSAKAPAAKLGILPKFHPLLDG